jgi:hypothetical protein
VREEHWQSLLTQPWLERRRGGWGRAPSSIPRVPSTRPTGGQKARGSPYAVAAPPTSPLPFPKPDASCLAWTPATPLRHGLAGLGDGGKAIFSLRW